MTIFDFELKYATSFVDNNGTEVHFNPLHKKNKGSMFTITKDGNTLGGEYDIREENGNIYLGWYGTEYLFVPTEVGFNLLTGEAISYSFTKIIP